MLVKTLGKLQIPTTPAVLQISATPTLCRGVVIQAWKANAGALYIGFSNMNITTGVGVIFVLPAASANNIPSWGTVSTLTRGIDLSTLYLGVDNANEGAVVSYLID